MAKKDKSEKRALREAKKAAKKSSNPLLDLPWKKIFASIIIFMTITYKLLTFANQKSIAYDTRPEFHKGEFVDSVESQESFEKIVNEKDLSLVKFYAPWCGHCKAMAPQWAQAAQQMKDESRVSFMSVDCTVPSNQATCKKYNVTGYPTIKGFRVGGVEFESESLGNDARSAPTAIKFVNNELAIDSIKTVSDISADSGLDSQNTYILGRFASKFAPELEKFKTWAEGKEAYDTTYNIILQINDSIEKSEVAIVKNNQISASYNAASFEAEDLTKFVFENFYAGSSSAPTIWSSELGNFGFPNFLILSDSPAEQQAVADGLLAADGSSRKVALGLRDNFMNIINKYDLKKQLGSKKPTVIGMDNENESYICSMDGWSVDSAIKSCFKDIENGKLEMWMKSEEIPEGDETHENGVAKVVAKNIKSLVFDESKDVLLEIYAPWCGHCKKLAPEYEKLAGTIAEKTDKVVIAKVDGTLNSMPNSLSYTGFPTLYWISANTNEVTKPNGRDYESLLKHVVNSASIDLDIEIPVKSEPVPAEAQAGEVVQLVGNNFKKIVNGEKNMLIKFYAPWCGHCKAMAPAFVELAEDLKVLFGWFFWFFFSKKFIFRILIHKYASF